MLGLAWAVCAALPGARGEPELFAGGGGWGAVSGVPESVRPPASDWNFQDGAWIGRIPAGASEWKWGGQVLRVADAKNPPPPPVALPLERNAFGSCVVRSLSVRYDSVVRSRRWSLNLDENPEFDPLSLPGRKAAAETSLELEDAASGQRWNLQPARRGREGGRFPGRNDACIYSGTLDDGDIDWNVVVIPQANGRIILQGRVMLLKSDSRRFRLRVIVRAGAPGVPVLQEELPPAILAVRGDAALALFPDLAEPRRFRAVSGRPDDAGIEFDLAATQATGNFPGRATFSLEVEAWKTADPETAQREALAKLARAGGAVALPESAANGELAAIPAFAPAAMRLAHPGGFRDRADAMQFLMLKTSALFRDSDWAASAFLCAAQDAQGEPQMALAGDAAILAVNPDPDLEAMLEMGQNRGLTLLERLRRNPAPAVWIRAGAAPRVLDHGIRALHLCDYPAVWEEGAETPGVDLGHAEAELISSLSCALKASGACLLVEDGSPQAPFTTYYADALVCAGADPAEMRRQRALAGPRPVLWTAKDPGPEAAELARNLGFVSPGKIEEN